MVNLGALYIFILCTVVSSALCAAILPVTILLLLDCSIHLFYCYNFIWVIFKISIHMPLQSGKKLMWYEPGLLRWPLYCDGDRACYPLVYFELWKFLQKKILNIFLFSFFVIIIWKTDIVTVIFVPYTAGPY